MPFPDEPCPGCPHAQAGRSGPCLAQSPGRSRYCRLAAAGHATALRRLRGEEPTRPTRPPVAPRQPRASIPLLPEDLYVTIARFTRDTASLAGRVPLGVDAVVGIARSGLMPAAQLSYHLHLPLWSVSRLGGPHECGRGYRLDAPLGPPRHALLVDDTLGTGNQMGACARLVRAAWPGVEVTRLAVYCNVARPNLVDLCASYERKHHYMEHHWSNFQGHVGKAALDFDGILCRDCPPGDDDDGPRYARFLRAAEPIGSHLPRVCPVPLIVTARHETYRAETLDWLERHGVRVDQLVMRDFPIDWGNGGAEKSALFKAEHYLQRPDLTLFVESDRAQAEVIARETNKAVLCPAAEHVWPTGSNPRPRANLDLAFPWGEQALYCPHRTPCGCATPGFNCGLGGRRAGQRVTREVCEGCLSSEVG